MLGSLQVGRPFLQGRVSGRAQQCPLVANTHSHDEFQGGPVWGASSLPHLTSCLYSPSPHPRCRPWEDHHFTWSSQPPPDASRARAFDIYISQVIDKCIQGKRVPEAFPKVAQLTTKIQALVSFTEPDI